MGPSPFGGASPVRPGRAGQAVRPEDPSVGRRGPDDRGRPYTSQAAAPQPANGWPWASICMNASGAVTNYAVEGGTPNQLRRQGWGKDSLKIGEVVTVEGFLARKPEAHTINGRTVTLADGRRVFGLSGAAGTNP